MKFIKVFRFDITYFFLTEHIKIIAILLSVLSFHSFYLFYFNIKYYLDYFFYITTSSKQGVIILDPLFWYVAPIVFLCLYSLGLYKKKIERIVLLQCSNRNVWWLSKILSTLSIVTLYYAFIYVYVALLCIIFNRQMVFYLSKETTELFHVLNSATVATFSVIFQLLILPVLFTFVLCVLQLVLSLLIKPIYSFFCLFLFMYISFFYSSPLLLSEYVKGSSSGVFYEQGVNQNIGLFFMFFVLICLIIIGIMIVKRKDF